MKNKTCQTARRTAATNIGFASGGVTCFVEIFVHISSAFLRIKCSAENPARTQSRKPLVATLTDNTAENELITNREKFEIYYTDSLGFISCQFAHRHSKRNAVSDYAHLLKDNWFFNCAYRNT
ncbi:hypothetical protein SAMN04488541_10882 [Thermoflexibacter ruber]|uniref:Uncharacterized protein n=1 Tax=Thermoflexibacter ruber TaxID=1003 RepID=A0A1I2K7D6_9BACT|nr:hypothetical protein SAMN04488541_10882 [Thermoflexibacter ruber]